MEKLLASFLPSFLPSFPPLGEIKIGESFSWLCSWGNQDWGEF
jgi:hypothetical protein